MSDLLDSRTSSAFWGISAAALLWNLLGLFAYVMQVTATPADWERGGYTPEQIAILSAIPAWATGASGVATTTGVVGCVGLLLRRSWCVPLFIVSFVALLVQDINAFVLMDTVGSFGMVPVYIQSAVLLIAILLVWYSNRCRAKGWLG